MKKFTIGLLMLHATFNEINLRRFRFLRSREFLSNNEKRHDNHYNNN